MRGTRVVIGRISNLYGAGQDLAKPQGLISQLCLTNVTRRPLGVYVSLDTVRDYVFADDAAAVIVACLERVGAELPGTVVTKVVASGLPTSIGDLIATSTRVFRRRPLLAQRASAMAATQVRDLRVRSVVWTDLDDLVRTPLVVGLRVTADDVVERYRAAGLAILDD